MNEILIAFFSVLIGWIVFTERRLAKIETKLSILHVLINEVLVQINKCNDD